MSDTEKKNLNVVIVPQTKIAFIGYVLLVVAIIVMMIQDKGENMLPKITIPVLVTYVLMAALGLYVINCTVLGHCNLYAWIMGYVLVVIGVLAVITVLMKMK